jgi:hypothetical protein
MKTQEMEEKQGYHAPLVRDYGNIREMTRNSTTGVVDSNPSGRKNS